MDKWIHRIAKKTGFDKDMAAQHNHIDVAELLIRAGSEINRRKKYGNAPLSFSNEYCGRNSGMSKLLRKHGGKP
jgi:hypothetical protein